MESSGILEYCRKTKDWMKGSVKSACSCNWPEPSKYCGCCSLSTGIYIRSVVMIILTVIAIGINGSILNYLLDIDNLINNTNLTEMEKPDTDWNALYLMYRAIVIYYIFWISFKCLYILIIFWTIYAVYKKNAKMIKILVYISVPNLIMDFFVSLADSILLNYNFKILILIFVLSEAYNILAMNSQYKKLRGKSRLVVVNTTELDSNTVQIYPYNAIGTRRDLGYRPGYHQAHCRSCTCHVNLVQTTISEPMASSVVTSTIINQEASSNTSENVIESNNIEFTEPTNNIEISENATRSNNEHSVSHYSHNLSSNLKEVKIDLSDVPVIYDERQLNIGISPVLDDRA